MVYGMAKRGLLLAPFVIGALWIAGDARWAISGAAGIAMTLLNLYLAAQIIGRVAESNPKLLIPAGMVSLMLGLALLTAIALVLRATDAVDFPVTGFTLIGAHFVVVLWEGLSAKGRSSIVATSSEVARVRS